MATNPPITIRIFTNVPAPGSGVKSDWPQQISNYVAPTAWTAPTFTNGWHNSGAPSALARYRKVGDTVQMEGLIVGGSLGTVAFSLPVGFRPVGDCYFAQISNNAFGGIIINPNGNVQPALGSAVWIGIWCQFSTVT